jgi:hypothetical protein
MIFLKKNWFHYFIKLSNSYKINAKFLQTLINFCEMLNLIQNRCEIYVTYFEICYEINKIVVKFFQNRAKPYINSCDTNMKPRSFDETIELRVVIANCT